MKRFRGICLMTTRVCFVCAGFASSFGAHGLHVRVLHRMITSIALDTIAQVCLFTIL